MAQPGGGSVDHGREPCPDRILDDIGGAFGMGAVGGGIWHLIKGAKNSPSGARTRGGIEVRRKHALFSAIVLQFSANVTWTCLFSGYQARGSKNRWQLCCLGRLVLII